MSYVVFHLADGQAVAESFTKSEMTLALNRCEALRKEQASGKNVRHICISPENDDQVGPRGVSDERPADYDWTKRRGGRRPD